MITPATASTGTTALTPISGTSAVARMRRVPKPPMPPPTAAAKPSAATAASVSGSRIKRLPQQGLARHRARAPVAVDRDVGERGLGDLDDRRIGGPPLGGDLDLDRDRRIADAQHVGIEGKHVAELHRLLGHEFT